MNFKDIQHKVGDTENLSYGYGGIPIFSTDGIHENIFDCFQKSNYSKDISILVLGAGAGAFDQRLLDNGYTNITATELVPESYRVKGTRLLEIDLNTDFSHLGNFDCIVALEIIEHLENQFHFIRCIRKMLKKEGALFLSTPNVENSFSRAKFFTVGRLHFFSQAELLGTGHITPIIDHIFRFNLEQSSLEITEYFTNGNVWWRVFRKPNIFSPLHLIFFISSFFVKRSNDFDINLYKITHKK